MKIGLKQTFSSIVIWTKWPEGATHARMIVYNRDGNSTGWGGLVKQTDEWLIRLGEAAKRKWCFVELHFDNGVVSERIPFGVHAPSKEELEWETLKIEYHKLAQWLGQRIGVNEKLRDRAKAELRPVGEAAHQKAMGEIISFKNIVVEAINAKKPLPSHYVKNIWGNVEAIEREANGKVQIYPDPPVQKWYKTPKYKFLKAFDQCGHDRHPHELRVKDDHLLFVKWGRDFRPMQGLYYGTEWNRVAKGDFVALSGLDGRALGTTLTGNLYITDGDSITHFKVPFLEGNTKEFTKENIGTWLREQRNAKGLTQRQLCKALKISTSSLWRYETGRRLPSKRTFAKIEAYFNL